MGPQAHTVRKGKELCLSVVLIYTNAKQCTAKGFPLLVP